MNEFNEKEFIELCAKLGTEPKIEEVTIEYDSSSYFNKVKKAVKTDRRGEVVFCVLRPNGRAIAVTCEEYPSGIFRIPTGGLGHTEDIIEAVHREVMEELGLKVDIIMFAGVIKIKFVYNEDYEMFYSYLFILKETGGRLLQDATDNEVSEIVEADAKEVAEIANKLNNIEGEWRDWGKFRYASTNAIYKILESRG